MAESKFTTELASPHAVVISLQGELKEKIAELNSTLESLEQQASVIRAEVETLNSHLHECDQLIAARAAELEAPDLKDWN